MIIPQLFAAGLGIEPKFSLSESDVLPLDDPAMLLLQNTLKMKNIQDYIKSEALRPRGQ